MTGFIKRDSGLVVPEEKSDKPPRKYRPLELQVESDRLKVSKAFEALLNFGCFRTTGIVLPGHDTTICDARKDLLLAVARQLLGDDFEYEELC